MLVDNFNSETHSGINKVSCVVQLFNLYSGSTVQKKTSVGLTPVLLPFTPKSQQEKKTDLWNRCGLVMHQVDYQTVKLFYYYILFIVHYWWLFVFANSRLLCRDARCSVALITPPEVTLNRALYININFLSLYFFINVLLTLFFTSWIVNFETIPNVFYCNFQFYNYPMYSCIYNLFWCGCI